MENKTTGEGGGAKNKVVEETTKIISKVACPIHNLIFKLLFC